jgi:enterochelin esterase-like enzyme
MTLTGTLLQVLLVVLALAALGVTVWLMPRMKRTLGRIGMLLGCQLCALLTLLAVGNAYFDFYHSWGDLTGNVSEAAAGPGLTGVAEVTHVRDSFIDAHRLSPSDGGLQSVVIHGRRSGISTPAYIYLPPQYAKEPNRRFPVTVAFTGYPGNAQNLITRMQLPQLASHEIAAARTQPMIFVMLRPMVTPPRDTECTDVPGGPQAETFFAQDLPTAIGAAYHTAAGPHGWGLLGDSTGGYCAAKLVMRHSDRFSAAVSLSGYFHALSDFTTGDLYGGSKAYRGDNDLFWRLEHLPPPPVSILVTSSRSGERDYPQVQRFIKLARPPTEVDSLILPSGGHHFSVWRRELPSALRWLSDRLMGQRG